MGELIDKLKAGYAAYDAGDEPRFRALVAALMADDCETRGPQYEAHSREEVVAFWLAFRAAFPDGRHEWLSAVEHDGGAAFELRYTGTHAGPLPGPDGEIPATGRTVDLRIAQFVDTEGGRVVRWREYMDSAELMAQLGLVPSAA